MEKSTLPWWNIHFAPYYCHLVCIEKNKHHDSVILSTAGVFKANSNRRIKENFETLKVPLMHKLCFTSVCNFLSL